MEYSFQPWHTPVAQPPWQHARNQNHAVADTVTHNIHTSLAHAHVPTVAPVRNPPTHYACVRGRMLEKHAHITINN